MTTGLRHNELTLGDCVVQMLGQTLAGIRRCSNCLTTTGLRQNELTLGDCCSDVGADFGRHKEVQRLLDNYRPRAKWADPG